MLVGGHVFFRAAVDDGGLCAHALGDPRRVHGGIARADDDNAAGKTGLDLRLHLLHPFDHTGHVALNVKLTRLPCAGGHEDVGIALGLELLHRGSRRAASDLHAVFLHQGDVLVDGLVGDAEGGDHVARHAAELCLALEDRGLHARAAKEVSRGDAGGSAADNGSLFPGQSLWLFDGGHQRGIAVLCGDELGVADVDGLLIEVAGTLVLTAVGADGAGDEGQGVLLGDQLEGRSVEPLAAKLDILGNVLPDGTSALTGRGKAVDPGHPLLTLAGGQGLDGLQVMIIALGAAGHVRDGGAVRAGKGAVGHRLHLFHHLAQTVVPAGL